MGLITNLDYWKKRNPKYDFIHLNNAPIYLISYRLCSDGVNGIYFMVKWTLVAKTLRNAAYWTSRTFHFNILHPLHVVLV